MDNTNIQSTYHLSLHPELYEPSRNNAFEFLLTGLANSDAISKLYAAGVNRATADDADYIGTTQDVTDVIRLSVAEASVPHFDLETIEIRRGNSSMKFAGTPSFSDGSLKCNDYVGARTKDMLLAWQALAYDVQSDVVQLASNYKFDCLLVEYAPDYSRIIRQWKMIGCWVKSLSEGSFSHDSPDKRSVDVTFVFDRAIPEIPSEG